MKTLLFHRLSYRSSRQGFTLMEMIIVLSIIALLMGMVIFKIGDFGDVAKRRKVEADILTFRETLAGYQLDNGSLPTTDQGLKALWSKPTVEPVPTHWHSLIDDEIRDPWDHPYMYRNPGKHNIGKYDIFSMGPDGQPDTEDDMGNWKDAKSTSP